MCGCTSGISSRTGWSFPGTASAAMPRRPRVAGAAPWSEARDHGRAGAAHLRKILARAALPVEDDPITAHKRAIGIRRVRLPHQRAASGTTAAAWTARTGHGPAARFLELSRLHDVRAGSLEIGDRETAAGPVRAGHDSTVRGDANGRPAAARAREIEPEHTGEHRLGG